jgi:hypothetical protein
MIKFAEFLAKSGMRKTLTGVYMFSILCLLLNNRALPAEQFVQLQTMVVLAVFTGNALEHYFKTTEKKEKPVAGA